MKPVPTRIREALKRYIVDRIEPGGFLRAVLENDLREAFGRADDDNREAMFAIVAYAYNEIPGISWGSPQRVADWLAGKDLPTYNQSERTSS